MQWDDIRSYDYTKTHTVKDWGWEFIRRDARYQNEWNKAFEAYLKRSNSESPLWFFFQVPDVSQYSDSEGRSTGTLNLVDPNNIDTFVIPSHTAMKWGLRYYQNPSAKKLVEGNIYIIKQRYRGDTVHEPEEDEISVAVEDHQLVVVLDLLRPLKTQIDKISEVASALQRQIKKDYPQLVQQKAEKVGQEDKKRWVRYLRCLDAKAAGIPRKKAAKAILPIAAQTPEALWDETIKQINVLATNRYRLMMY